MAYGMHPPKNINSSMQARYLADPRLALALELQKVGGSTAPVHSQLEGLARMLQGGLAGYQMGNLQKEYAQRSDDYSKTLAQAYQAGAGTPAMSNLPGPNMDGSAGYSRPAVAPDQQMMAQILMGNPDTQDVATKMMAQMNGGDAPSSVQEYREFQKLTPAQQEQYLLVKRASPYLNAGNAFIQPSPTTGQPMNNIPIQPKLGEMPDFKRNQAMAIEQGKNQADAIKNLPVASDTANMALRYVDELKKHPGLSDVVGARNPLSGAVASYIPFGGSIFGQDAQGHTNPIPGTKAADFETRRKQLVGGTFLEAYNSLKGGGQITEVEGNKAQDAIARMDTAQSEQEFNKALSDYEEIIKLGLSRARSAAGVSVSNTPPSQSTNVGGAVSYQDYFK